MRFYKQPHAFYAGVDLHARTMFIHILLAALSNRDKNALWPGTRRALLIAACLKNSEKS